jgi:hypothetical protein
MEHFLQFYSEECQHAIPSSKLSEMLMPGDEQFRINLKHKYGKIKQ